MRADVRNGSFSTKSGRWHDVRFTPQSDQNSDVDWCRFCANHLHRSASIRLSPLTAAKGTSVTLVLNQCNCIECSLGKRPDTQTMAPGSDDGSFDSVHDRSLCISV